MGGRRAAQGCITLLLLALSSGTLNAFAGDHSATQVPYPGTTWGWAVPKPHGHSLAAVALSGSTGYATAAGFPPSTGTLLKTTDTGRSWAALNGPPRTDFDDVEVFGEDLVLSACRSFVFSSDGGASFAKRPLPRRGDRECSLATDFVSRSIGFAAYTDGALVQTRDAGRTFKASRIPVPESGRLVTLAFADAENGFAITHGARFETFQILRSTDGGGSWQQVATSGRELRSLEVANASTVYALGSGVLRSTDGGRTFESATLNGAPQGVQDIECAGPRRCLLVASERVPGRVLNLFRGVLALTTDGGQTARLLPRTAGAAAVAFGDDRRVLAVGERGTTLRSTDLGASFERVGRGQDDTSYFGYVRNDPGGILAPVTSEGFNRVGLSRSLDGGASFQPIRIPVPRASDVIDFSFGTRRSGSLLLRGRGRTTLLRTSDGGGRWRIARRERGARIRGLLMVDARRVLAGDAAGLRVSRDGGRRFRYVRAGRGSSLDSFDRGRGVIVAFGPRAAVVSRDRGRTWRPLTLPRRRRTWDVDMLDRRRGFAIVRPGRLMITTNGGRAWRRAAGVRGVAADVSFSDLRTGFVNVSSPSPRIVDDFLAMEGRGVILRTTDGGRSWRRSFDFPGFAVHGVVATGRGRAVAQIGGDLIYGPSTAPPRP